MKKFLLLFFALFLLTGCGKEYKVHNKTIQLDQKIEFRHLIYKTSTAFDYGSDGEFRYYNLYDKKQNTIYSITIEKLKGIYEDDKKKVEEDTSTKNVKGKKEKKYYSLTYTKEDKLYHTYYLTYDKNEYYKIEFFNVIDSTSEFEKKFMSYVSLEK